MTGRLAELVGATPVTVQQAEISQAFSTGVIDSMITSPATGVDMHVWDYVKHYTDVAAMSTWNIVVVNERMFSRLDDKEKEAIEVAAKAAEERAWANAGDVTVRLTQVLRDNGIAVKEPTDQMREEIKELRDVFIKEWLQSAGEEGEKIIEAYRGAQ